ncbi:hypothetical protein QYM36_001544 [Artemia franciscana]|uniref:NAD-dependent epimerase/dehydratase domain-containing protein n=3 Tax=Artemia franciscana TaxID=6661 RepID=A0AA88IAX3_ARTSF|nr:hypothetical protein QYM36_001544 [Artemia franciscana]
MCFPFFKCLPLSGEVSLSGDLFIMIHLLAVLILILESSMAQEKTAIVFGGNGFMGSETVLSLLTQFDKVIVVNRGNWYYDSNLRIMQRKEVIHIKCDRFKHKNENNLLKCEKFIKLLGSITNIDLVVDFSAYKPKAISDALEVLKGKVHLYIYISSDSVYEVCEGYNTASGLSKETDSVRPKDMEKRRMLARRDSYGDDKLSGEEVLEASNVPYLILRLPDVIGPRDTTHRWWTYQLWMQLFTEFPLAIPIPRSNQILKTSYVYSKDVASTILNVTDLSRTKSEILNQSYNIGFEEGFTLKELLYELESEMGQNIDYDLNADENAFTLFPSVSRGMVDITKAKDMIGFVPTKWKQALREVVQFYSGAALKYPSELKDVVDNLLDHVVPDSKRDEFSKLVNRIASNGVESQSQESPAHHNEL